MIINENAQELYPADARTETGPGELLSRKREALGVTQQQVAAELHITMHYVRALEENAFEKLPGDVFVRGYIRAYAGFLKLDPQVLINVFNEYSGKKVVQYEISVTKAKRRRDKNLPWIIVSGVAFVVIAVGLWYFGSSGVPAPTPTPGAATGGQTQRPPAAAGSTIESANANVRFPAAAPVTSSVTPPVTSPVSPPVTPPVAPPALDGLQQVPATLPGQLTAPAQAVPAQPVLTTPTPSNAGQALPAPTAPIQTTPQQSSPVPASSPSANPVLPTPPPLTPSGGPQQPAQGSTPDDVARVINVDAGGEDVVQITFNGNSHVQVDDGNDTQIYNDMQEAGDVVLISGSAPFDILLGDASTTELRLNGSKVDFSSSIRIDNSARLTIGL